MSEKVGGRVGAISHSDGDTYYLFGFGVYEGLVTPPPEVKFLGVPLRNANPKIVLDSGEVVWGCECWWGPEEDVRKNLEGKTIVNVPGAFANLSEDYQIHLEHVFGQVCEGCQGKKIAFTSFCRDCYNSLPWQLRLELWRPMRARYMEYYTACLEKLQSNRPLPAEAKVQASLGIKT